MRQNPDGGKRRPGDPQKGGRLGRDKSQKRKTEPEEHLVEALGHVHQQTVRSRSVFPPTNGQWPQGQRVSRGKKEAKGEESADSIIKIRRRGWENPVFSSQGQGPEKKRTTMKREKKKRTGAMNRVDNMLLSNRQVVQDRWARPGDMPEKEEGVEIRGLPPPYQRGAKMGQIMTNPQMRGGKETMPGDCIDDARSLWGTGEGHGYWGQRGGGRTGPPGKDPKTIQRNVRLTYLHHNQVHVEAF